MKKVIVVVGVDYIVINQIELFLYLQNCKVVDWVKVYGIYIIFYMMLVYGKVLKDEVIVCIVVKYNVILVQVILVWVMGEGYFVIFLFIRCENLVSNLLVLELYLDVEDRVVIEVLDCNDCLVSLEGLVFEWD